MIGKPIALQVRSALPQKGLASSGGRKYQSCRSDSQGEHLKAAGWRCPSQPFREFTGLPCF
jgi:hypothetical protein